MCLALENWLFLRKKRFLTCYFLPYYFVSNSSFFFSYLVSYLLLFVWLCAVYVCVYELLAIKYIESQPNFHRALCECVLNCLLLYLESFGLFFFLIFQTTLVLVHHAHHSRPEEGKKFDYKTNRFLCLFLVLCI